MPMLARPGLGQPYLGFSPYYYNVIDNAGGSFADLSGNLRIATAGGAVSSVLAGGAAGVAAHNYSAAISWAAGVANTNGAITLECWTRGSNNSTYRCGTTATGSYWQLSTQAAGCAWVQTQGGALTTTNLTPLATYTATGEGIHFVATRNADGRTIKLYTNGVFVASGVAAAAANAVGASQPSLLNALAWGMAAAYPFEASAAQAKAIYRRFSGLMLR